MSVVSDFTFLKRIPLQALEHEIESRGAAVVSQECMNHLMARARDTSALESKLRRVAALRIVTEWPNWRGRLVRRWIAQVERSIS